MRREFCRESILEGTIRCLNPHERVSPGLDNDDVVPFFVSCRSRASLQMIQRQLSYRARRKKENSARKRGPVASTLIQTVRPLGRSISRATVFPAIKFPEKISSRSIRGRESSRREVKIFSQRRRARSFTTVKNPVSGRSVQPWSTIDCPFVDRSCSRRSRRKGERENLVGQGGNEPEVGRDRPLPSLIPFPSLTLSDFVLNEAFLIVVPRCHCVYHILVTGKPRVFTVTKMGFAFDPPPRFLALGVYYRLRMYVPARINLATNTHTHTRSLTHSQIRIYTRTGSARSHTHTCARTYTMPHLFTIRSF